MELKYSHNEQVRIVPSIVHEYMYLVTFHPWYWGSVAEVVQKSQLINPKLSKEMFFLCTDPLKGIPVCAAMFDLSVTILHM